MPQQKISPARIYLFLRIVFITSAVFAFLLIFGKSDKTDFLFTNIPKKGKVAIMTDKREYLKGEKVNFILINKLPVAIFYVTGESNCSTWSYEVYNFLNNDWNKIFTHIPVCITPGNERNFTYDILLPNNFTNFTWNQNQWDYDISNYKIQAGRYRISMRYENRESLNFTDNIFFLMNS